VVFGLLFSENWKSLLNVKYNINEYKRLLGYRVHFWRARNIRFSSRTWQIPKYKKCYIGIGFFTNRFRSIDMWLTSKSDVKWKQKWLCSPMCLRLEKLFQFSSHITLFTFEQALTTSVSYIIQSDSLSIYAHLYFFCNYVGNKILIFNIMFKYSY